MKLSQGMKERISSIILAAKFGEEEKSFVRQLNELGDAIYAAIPGIDKAAKLPKGWLPTKQHFSCNFGGLRDYIGMSAERPIPFENYDRRQDFANDHEFTTRFRAIQDAKANFQERRKEVKRELEGVLKGVNTDKQLLAIWPEAIKWLPSTPVPVPVVQSVDRLKQLLGEDL